MPPAVWLPVSSAGLPTWSVS
uniref:Uncharacterized protein n=1 Tax=Anguilla anguilla TaxID=7936 RepID=A0A0E9TTH5_ANGAN